MDELLERIDELLDKSMGLPGGRCVVNAEKLRVILDDIRLNLPQEIKQARGIVADRVDIINSAKREAENIIRAADERANAMAAQEEITHRAQRQAAEIMGNAQQKSREMRRAAQEFVDDLMRRADEGLTQNLAEVRKTRASLRQQRPASPQES